jgi:hypothetical protein
MQVELTLHERLMDLPTLAHMELAIHEKLDQIALEA